MYYVAHDVRIRKEYNTKIVILGLNVRLNLLPIILMFSRGGENLNSLSGLVVHHLIDIFMPFFELYLSSFI